MGKIIIPISFALLVLLTANTVLATDPLIQATFSTNPVTASPGNDGYIQMVLENTGTASAQSVKVTLTSTDAGIVIDSNYRWVDIGGLANGDTTSALFKFSVPKTTPTGLYRINFEIDYCKESGSNCRTTNQFAIIKVQSPSALEITSVEPSSLRPGEKTNMVFTLTNRGGNSIDNIIFTWTSSDSVVFPLGSGNRIIIPTIGANSEYNLSTKVFASQIATSGIYPLTISIQYVDKSGTNQTITSTAGIEIGEKTDFDLSIQDYTSDTLTFSIANIGISLANSVSIRIPNQSGFSVTGATSVFLSDLNPGDYTTVTFEVSSTNITQNIPMNMTQNIPSGRNISEIRNMTQNERNMTQGMMQNNLLKVEISYTDTNGFRQVIEKEISITGATGSGMRTQFSSYPSPFQTKKSGLGIWLYLIIGAVAIIAVVVFFKFRKRKKK